MEHKEQNMEYRIKKTAQRETNSPRLSTFDFRLSTRASRGFSLVEMIISLGIFTICLFIATSSFLAVVNADRKSRAVRIATDNLNLALEDMSRSIKTGYEYHCGGNFVDTDCDVGENETSLLFINQSGEKVAYKKGTGFGLPGGGGCGSGFAADQGCILREDDGSWMLVTSPEISIKSLKFIVSGSDTFPSGDRRQPAVVVAVEGELGANPTTKTTFKIQTTITQRLYDK